MKRSMLMALVLCLSIATSAQAQWWKKVIYGGLIATGAATVVLGIAMTKASADAQDGTANSEADSNEPSSDSNSNTQPAKININVLEEDFFNYYFDYKQVVEINGNEFTVEQIQQPYVKQAFMEIMQNPELSNAISSEVPGKDMQEKITKVLLSLFNENK